MATAGVLINSTLISAHRYGVFNLLPGICTQIRHYAARRGTRERKQKKKVKKEVIKLTFAEKLARMKKAVRLVPDILDLDEKKKELNTVDDVFLMDKFKTPTYSFADAIQNFRDICHPTMLNLPKSKIYMKAEINMIAAKATRTLDDFSKTILFKHVFDHGEPREILAFSKSEEDINIALKAGAEHAGGVEIIKQIQSGDLEINAFNVFVAHPNILPELLVIRGLMKKKFPSLSNGTLGPDMEQVIYSQLHGMRYNVKAYPKHKEYGYVQVPIGTEDMPTEHLEENLQIVVDNIMKAKPKRPGSFITRIYIVCPPDTEKFKIEHTKYIPEEESEAAKTKEIEEEEAEEEAKDNIAVPVSN